MGSKGRPYRTLSIEGFEVLVGRGADDNDHLTFEVADRHDLWFHVGGGTPGSHVVIRNPDQAEIPKDVIEAAAQLAAWHSKARGAPRVEVHYCRVSDVSKDRDQPPGEVMIKRYSRIKVAPRNLGEGES